MGPVRGGLIAALLPGVAWAEVCDKERPGWDGAPVTAFGEMLAQFSTLPALVLLVLSAIVIRFRSQWGAVAVLVLWTVWVSVVAFYEPTDSVVEAAIREGCIGSPVLFIAAVAAICIAMIIYTLPPIRREE